MKKNLLLTAALIACLFTSVFSQDVFNPTVNSPVDNFTGTLPSYGSPFTFKKWIRTPNPALPVPFNTDKFKAYFYRASGGAYDTGMAFRLRFPNNYNPNNATKYPVILFMHGIGEAGPVKDNETNLSWGAKEFESRIDAGQFNAFLLFPQTVFGDWAFNFNNINATLDALQQYCNADPDRIITMGLSLGGDGTMKYTFAYPQRSAISIPASPGSIGDFTQDPTAPSQFGTSSFIHVPFWIASGGLDDQFSNPARVGAFVNNFTSKGGDVRWTYYPERGHGTWPYMWDEPFLVPYWQNAHKANPLVFGKQTNFPANTPFSVKIGITPGFAQYQWQRNNVDIANTTNDITVNQTGTYRVRFRRVANGVWSDWSPNPVVITQPAGSDTQAPSVPGNLRVTATSTTSVSLDWDNSTDNVSVTGYDVFVNGTKRSSPVNSDFVVDNLNPATTYAFTVQARDAAGNSSASTPSVNGTTATPPDITNPSAPANFRVLSVTTSSVSLDWDNSSDNIGVVGYDVFVNGSKRFSPTSSDVVATALNASTTYTFTVQARDAAGNLSAFSQVTGTTATAPDLTPPSAPSNLRVLSSTSSSISLDWDNSTDNVGVAGYDVFVNGTKLFSNTSSDIVATGLNASTTYAFTVQARDLSNNFSAFSSSVNGSTTAIVDNSAPSVPANVRVTGTTTTTISLDWDNSTDNVGVTGYDVFVNGTKRFSPVNSDYIVDNLNPSTTYTFTVQAHDGAGNFSAASPGITGTTAAVATGSALSYKYYQGAFTVLPNFNTLTPVKTGSSANIDISVRNAGVNDNYAFLWEGYIILPTAGTYTFETVSDDGSKLYFNTTYSANANALVNNDGLHASTSVTGAVTMAAGTYPIAISFFEATGGENMQVYWTGPGIGRQLIPNSAFTNTGTPPSATNGLNFKYYEGTFTTLPNFSALTPVKTGTTTNVDLGLRNAGVNDNYAFLWEGFITLPTAGQYTFETISDDGSKLYFNTSYSAGANALVNNDGLHAANPVTGSVTVAAGKYPIAITFFEATGGESMQVYWTGPGITRQLIPNSVLSISGTPPSATSGLNYKYYQGTFTTLPNFSALTPIKTGTSTNTDIGVRTAGVNDNFAFLWEGFITLPTAGQYTFETVSDDGSKLYFNTTYSAGANALVNNDGLHAPTSAFGTTGNMAAGTYPIAISFFEATGGEGMQVYWTGPGISRQLVPNAAFTTSGSTPPTSTSGLNYRYYEGSFTVLPNFNALPPLKTGTTPAADISVRNFGVNDNFAFIWEGYIHLPTTGTYIFETVSDDGSKLYFNTTYAAAATALVSNDGLHAATSATGSVTATAGAYPIAITFFEATGGENMQVYWTGPGITRQLIPNNAFTQTSALSSETAMLQPGNLQSTAEAAGDKLIIKQVFPNPFSESFTLNFYNAAVSARVSVDMVDLSGRTVYKQQFGNLAVGHTTLKINPGKQALMPGVYFVRMLVNGVPTKVTKLIRK